MHTFSFFSGRGVDLVMRSLLLGIPLVLVLAGCPAPPCSATCTTGCCSASGECLSGTAPAACGTGGAMCSACGTDQVCSAAKACVDDGYDDVNAFIADVLPAFCARAVRCKDAHLQASCEDVVKNRLLNSNGVLTGTAIDVLYVDATAAVKDSRATFDGVKGKRCLKAVRELSCEDNSLDSNVDCQGTFVGKVIDAQSCYFDGDCALTSYCSSSGMTCPGTCQARKSAGAVASRDRECQQGQYVYDGKCLAFSAASSSCAPVAPATAKQTCVEGSFCNSSNICAARGTLNAACTAGNQCNATLVCSNGTCQTPAALNGTCNLSPFIPCQIDLHCDGPTAGMPGTCQTLAPVSGACFLTSDCATPLYCDGARLVPTPARGACQAKKTLTTACSGAGQCVNSAYCDAPGSSTCVAKKPANAACTAVPPDQCVDGYACTGGTCRPTACHDPTP